MAPERLPGRRGVLTSPQAAARLFENMISNFMPRAVTGSPHHQIDSMDPKQDAAIPVAERRNFDYGHNKSMILNWPRFTENALRCSIGKRAD
jgi:hypothetical protein